MRHLEAASQERVDFQVRADVMPGSVVTDGTAAGMGFGSTVHAKTGTADIVGHGPAEQLVHRLRPSKDVAIAALVLNSGYDGAQFAAPEVESSLDSY